MVLTGKEIVKRLNGDIIISPFNAKNLQPNSVDLTLHSELKIYTNNILDCRKQNPTTTINIPVTGYELKPGTVYLARTVEWTETHNLVPMLHGKSSLGRLGLETHVCAGLGDIGWCGHWVLELACIQPIIIYPGMPIAQVVYHEVVGDTEMKYNGKYQNQLGVMSSQYHQNFEDEK